MEIWKDIKGYKGLYQVSNLGRVKSLKRKGCLKERILKSSIDGGGYYQVNLSNVKRKTIKVHQLVAIEFLNHVPCGYKLVVDHIDFDRKNNRVSNLRIITQRENTYQKHLPSSSKFVGVYWHKSSKKWVAQSKINGKQKNLGYFTNELDASKAYEMALALTINTKFTKLHLYDNK